MNHSRLALPLAVLMATDFGVAGYSNVKAKQEAPRRKDRREAKRKRARTRDARRRNR